MFLSRRNGIYYLWFNDEGGNRRIIGRLQHPRQQVATLVQGEQEAGYHEVRFDASNLASGACFYRLHAGTDMERPKLLLLR